MTMQERHDLVQEQINALQEYDYPELWIEAVESMLYLDATERPDFDELHNMFKGNQSKYKQENAEERAAKEKAIQEMMQKKRKAGIKQVTPIKRDKKKKDEE